MAQATNFSVPVVGPASPTTMAQRIDDNFKAIRTGHSGASRPSYAVAGTVWQDTSVANETRFYLYDGTDDNLLYTVNTSTGLFTTNDQDVIRSNASQSLTATQQGRAWANIGGSRENDDLIINGCFDVAQRGTSQTTSGYGSVDRWASSFSGGSVSMSREGFAAGDTLGSNNKPFYLRQTVSGQSSGSHFALREHRIENVRSYAGQTITVLGWARRSSGSGNMAVEVFQFFGTGGSPSSPVLGIGSQQVSLSTLWQPFAVTMTVPNIDGKVGGTNLNDFFALLFWSSAGSDFNTRSANLGIQTISIDLFGIHIRKGVVPVEAANYYSPPPIWETEPACLRFYEKLQTDVYGAFASSANFNSVNWPFKVRKRATPVMSWSLAGANPLGFGVDGARAINTANSGPGILAGTSADAEL